MEKNVGLTEERRVIYSASFCRDGNSDKITVLTESELKIYTAHVGSLGMLAGKRIVY